jgi:sulfate permease, SulP family
MSVHNAMMLVSVPTRSLLNFRPALIDALRGYDRQQLTRDVGAGLTVGVVALPLAMAFAMASGLPPQAGLFTAIIAGFLISALGGSRVQIGGPAGAFIVIVYGIVERYGVASLMLATAMSGILLLLMGLLRLGTLIRFIPVAVVIGFTNGIAVLIALSQVKDFLGLKVTTMPADFPSMVHTLWSAAPTLRWTTVGLALASLALIVLWQLLTPKLAQCTDWRAKLALLPGSVLVLVLAPLAVLGLGLEVDTIGSRFGGMAATLPSWQWPAFQVASLRDLMVPTLTLALLGAIESLLCARVADGMLDTRHDPNQELMAQGVANLVTPFFGGMPATGTIARTVTNIKSGGRTPVAGMVHALTILVVVLVAAPLAQDVPLAALAAILMFVAWNMGEWREFAHLRDYRLPYRVTLLAVFGLTVVVDLTAAVEVGLFAAGLTFIYRISSLSRMDAVSASDQPLLAGQDGQIKAFRFYGALFFGAVKLVENLSLQLPARALVLDFKNAMYVDSSGADTLLDLHRACEKAGIRLILCGLQHQALDIVRRTGLLARLAEDAICPDLPNGLKAACQPSPASDR